MTKLVWLALGAFAIGAQSFMLAGVLPRIAAEYGASVAAAGGLITAFALSYAVSSPILSSLLAQAPRKGLLIGALGFFGLVSLGAAAAPSLVTMMAAQMALAVAAGLYMPTANAVAVSLVGPEQRARAIAVVTGGLTLSIAFGAPLGIALTGLGGWRITFLFVSALALIGVVGLAVGLPGGLPRGASTLRERFAVARRPAVLLALATTALWTAGAFAVFSQIASYLAHHVGLTGAMVSAALVAFGVGSAVGNELGGRASDRFGPMPTLKTALTCMIVLMLSISLIAWLMTPGPLAVGVAFVVLALWGAMGWAGHPAQSTRLVGLAPDAAVVALSLNASALYFGIAGGAALGSLTLGVATTAELGLVGAACEALALAFLLCAVRSPKAAGPLPAPAPAE